MKTITFLLGFFILTTGAFAQATRDVIQLKNGSLLKGQIIEQSPPDNLKLQTADGSVFVYRYDEIEKITREEVKILKTENKTEPPDFNEYGGTFGLGIAIGGGGIVGAPLRFNFSRKFAFEAGVFIRPMYIEKEYIKYDYYGHIIGSYNEEKFIFPPMIALGFDFFFSEQFNSYKQKIYKQGLLFRFGHTLTDAIGENMFAIGWAKERFKVQNKNNSYLFELGIGFLTYDRPIEVYGIGDETDFAPILYWKLHWNFYLNPKKQ